MKEPVKSNPSDVYKKRVDAIKMQLPSNYVDIINANYPEYNSSKGYNLVKNVRAGRTADVILTEIFEKVVRGELTMEGVKSETEKA